MKPYGEYKETGLAWLERIPKHWEWLYLFQVASEQTRKNIQNLDNNVLSLSYGSIIRKENKFSGLVPKEYEAYNIVSAGNIILRLTDLQNDKRSLRTGLVKERGIITSAYTCLKPKGNPAYLHYVLHFYDTQKVFYGLGGGVRQSVGYAEVRALSLPWPPRAEQDKIVQFLDHKLTKIHTFIENKKKLIAFLQEQKQAIINQAVTKGLDPHAEMKDSGLEWLGDVPKHWEIITIKKIAQLYSGKEVVQEVPESPTAFNVYGSGGIFKYTDSYLHDGTAVLFGRKGTIGKPILIHGKFWVVDTMYYCICNASCLPEYLYLIFSVFPWSHFTTKTALPSIVGREIFNAFIALPNVDEQRMLVDNVFKKIERIELLVSKAEREIDLVQEYKISLVSAVVTGQVDVANYIY